MLTMANKAGYNNTSTKMCEYKENKTSEVQKLKKIKNKSRRDGRDMREGRRERDRGGREQIDVKPLFKAVCVCAREINNSFDVM